jgi:hypothetical protein
MGKEKIAFGFRSLIACGDRGRQKGHKEAVIVMLVFYFLFKIFN